MGLKMLDKRLPKEHAMKSIINSNILSTRAGIIGESKMEEMFPMCKNWGIDPRDLITGVKCEKCEQFGMLKSH